MKHFLSGASFQEGVEKDCVLCLVGNKLDLCDNNDDFRVVKHKDGSRLADVEIPTRN